MTPSPGSPFRTVRAQRGPRALFQAVLASIATIALGASCHADQGPDTRARVIPAPAVDEATSATSANNEVAVLAGGCFWGVQSVYNRVKGVKHTVAGYSGGTRATANYNAVSSETTQHAESLKIEFDPNVVSYGTLLRIFFSVVHDPTQLNRQGPDVGTSYRSVIFYTSPEQQKVAAGYITQLDAAQVFPRKIVTQVTRLQAFYDGEDYHQDYADKNPDNPYIQICDIPKIEGLKEQFPQLFQPYHGH